MFWVPICTVHLTACCCHVTFTFQSHSTLYSCVNLKELLAWSRCEISSFSDCNWARTHNLLVRKTTLNQFSKFTKWLRYVLSTYLYGAFDCMFLWSHVTYTFQSESTHYSCLNVKELLGRTRREMWSLSDCNWCRNQNHLVRKRTLNYLVQQAK